ncbi:MAG: molybdopterin molybdotransferase [Gammaproteobacteria bacterium]|jgi:molybdopterin molybdotransferase
MDQSNLAFDPSCMDEYDPNSLPVDEALRRIDSGLTPITGVERVGIRDALGRVLAEPVNTPIDVPSHTNSAMDGYALAAASVAMQGQPISLAVVGTSWAGRPFKGNVGPGQCARIMTGGVMPLGTDTVVIQEHVKADGDEALFEPEGVTAGDNVRAAGEDLAAGSLVLAAGKRIGPAELGMLASVGVVEVWVRRRLRVAFFSTGDELRSLGQSLDAGSVYDSNRYTLYGMLTRLGAEIIDMGVVPDQREAVQQAFVDASNNADAVITSGGVSVGEADFVKETLEAQGQVNFWKIAMKPGRPLAFGRVRDAVFFGLPGNPVSVMVTYYQFVQPALRRMMGELDTRPPRIRVRCGERLKKRSGRVEFQRGILNVGANGEMFVTSTGGQGSGILSSMHAANCFIVLSMENEGVEPDELVDVEPFFGVI